MLAAESAFEALMTDAQQTAGYEPKSYPEKYVVYEVYNIFFSHFYLFPFSIYIKDKKLIHLEGFI